MQHFQNFLVKEYLFTLPHSYYQCEGIYQSDQLSPFAQDLGISWDITLEKSQVNWDKSIT